MKKCLISLHPGNFIGGSSKMVEKQNKLISKICNIKIINLNFPKNNWNDTFKFLQKKLLLYSKKYEIYLIGRSSGGYLAKKLLDTYPIFIKKVIYFSPVFNPKKRQEIYPRFKEAYNFYFRFNKFIPSTSSFNPQKEYIYLAINDKNVPIECFTKYQKKYIRNTLHKTHNGLCLTTNIEFIKLICKIINE